VSPELFVLFKALLGFGLPLAFGLQQLHALRRDNRRAAAASERQAGAAPGAGGR
jgi:hypothetical protein